jgi:AraC family transcriptional regulator of adaptative response/methylated-DNA-[protein]-cysteine methyltransferase
MFRILYLQNHSVICRAEHNDMETQANINYHRIAQAIDYIQANFQQQPSLDEVAEKIHLSPSHFQRLFTEWAGTSPKKFLQYISIEHAKKILLEQQATLSDTAHATGLSSTSRLHDLFVNIEGMTPAEYKNGGQNLSIRYSFAESPFGALLVASTHKGVCHMAFEENEETALVHLRAKFPKATFFPKFDLLHQNALSVFQNDWSKLSEIKLHLKGTDFQLKVWESLLKIPMGKLSTYGAIAQQIGNPAASRAVGTAIGSNPIAFLIPCHRVIQASGTFGGYMWGPTRKAAIIGWEGAKTIV